MKTTLISIPDHNRSFLTRFWREVRWFVLLFIAIGLYELITYGMGIEVSIVSAFFSLFIISLGLARSVQVLYRIVDDGNGNLEIQILHLNQVKTTV